MNLRRRALASVCFAALVSLPAIAFALDFDPSDRIYQETYVGELATPMTPEVDSTGLGGLNKGGFGIATLTGTAVHAEASASDFAPWVTVYSQTPTSSTIGGDRIGVRGAFENPLLTGNGGYGLAGVSLDVGILVTAGVRVWSGQLDLTLNTQTSGGGVPLPNDLETAIFAGAPFVVDLFIDTVTSVASASVEVSGFAPFAARLPLYVLLPPLTADFSQVIQLCGIDSLNPADSFAVDFTTLELYSAPPDYLFLEKLSDTSGYLSSPGSPGANPGGLLLDGDQFGSEVEGIGDLDGDGVPDLAVGAYTDDTGGIDAGAIYILFMNPDGTVKARQKIAEGTGGLQADLDADDRFGSDLALLHDVDGDGVQDLAVGAYNDDDGASNAGALYILFLNPDGTTKPEQKISNLAGNLGALNDADDGFGNSPAGIGDLDGDGIPDVAVGSFLDNAAGGNAGSLYILFLNADGTVKASQKITEGVGGFTGTLAVSDRFGSGIANLGDLDGDGRPELAVGARFGAANDGGVVYLLSLNADGTVFSYTTIEQGVNGFLGPTESLDRFSRPARVGDLDGDGVADMAVGAVTDDDAATDAGAVWILFLNPDGSVHDQRKISLVPGLEGSDFFGGGVTSTGDLDGDGVIELVVGANGDDDGGADRGAAYVLFLDGSPAVCGNGVLDPLEGCDDGNTVSGDGCESTCLVPMPEPGALAMLVWGVASLWLLDRRRWARAVRE